MARLQKDHGAWSIDELVRHYLTSRVTDELHKTDPNKLRLYECYQAGSEYRWFRFRAMTAIQLRAVAADTGVQERQLHTKGDVLRAIADELDATGQTIVDEVYDQVLPKVKAIRK